ncbi:uncharacterized protein LOC110882516 [Helianthus annuus]|uniref:uncharacterized protein LOC110882516 n=1 Tax=Helianthus annuus TaxID=4232 RepID=UPI000B90695C|nr:uncharacterized protein LOC110882516 [Helianthus annuus]
MHQLWWMETLNDYECEIRYHPDKAYVVTDAFSRKERIKQIRVCATRIELRTSVNEKLLDTEKQALLEAKGPNEGLGGTVEQLASGKDGILRFNDTIWISIFGGLRDLILEESHNSKYYAHLGGDKMYQDLKRNYWWMDMKKSIATHVAMCLTCSQVKAEHQKPLGLTQQLKIPKWK